MNPHLDRLDIFTRRQFLNRSALSLGTAALSVSPAAGLLAADGPAIPQSQPWKRREKALLNNCPAAQPWFHHSFYSPCVIFAQGRFHLWFEGTDVLPALNQGRIGYAQSDDGIDWKLHPTNPVLAADQLPFKASNLSTPWVLFDDEEQIYKMWFVATTKAVRSEKEVIEDQDLGYASSKDGIAWKFHDRVLVEKCRRPCVRKEKGRFRMWMNARPKQTDSFAVGYRHVYEYESADGIAWTRREKPAIVAGGITQSCVYPCVLKVGATYYMWHIGHLAKPDRGAYIDIFCDTSDDGTTWQTNYETAAFTAARDRSRWDWKLVSTPCVVEVGDELYLYYMGSNIPTNFNFFEGGNKNFGMHLGLAAMPREKLGAG